jgi:uncharacterized protein (DUF58 family)
VGTLVVFAVVLGRMDLVLLAAPFALGTAWSLSRRPDRPPRVALSAGIGAYAEGSEVEAHLELVNPSTADYDVAVARVNHAPWLHFDHSDRPYASAIRAGRTTQLRVGGPAARWGRHSFGPATGYAAVCDGLLISASVTAPALSLKVHPVTEAFKADDAMPYAAGLVGAHRSRRPGDGGELAGIRQYAPGDRLRRIVWRVTLRTGQPHVAQTLSDRDAEVVLLLDVVSDAGWSGGIGGPASVLDTTVRAAAGIAEHYLERGDRVSMLEYSFHPRRLRPATGHRQFQAVLEWLLHVRPVEGPPEPIPALFGPHLLPATALTIVLTPLLEAHSAAMIGELARSGRFVVTIDTLGDAGRLRQTPPGSWLPIAHRLWSMEREHHIGQLREAGVPVVAWAGAGSLDQVLRDVSRMAAAPRVRLS